MNLEEWWQKVDPGSVGFAWQALGRVSQIQPLGANERAKNKALSKLQTFMMDMDTGVQS